jgi:hypothetical protein
MIGGQAVQIRRVIDSQEDGTELSLIISSLAPSTLTSSGFPFSAPSIPLPTTMVLEEGCRWRCCVTSPTSCIASCRVDAPRKRPQHLIRFQSYPLSAFHKPLPLPAWSHLGAMIPTEPRMIRWRSPAAIASACKWHQHSRSPGFRCDASNKRLSKTPGLV